MTLNYFCFAVWELVSCTKQSNPADFMYTKPVGSNGVTYMQKHTPRTSRSDPWWICKLISPSSQNHWQPVDARKQVESGANQFPYQGNRGGRAASAIYPRDLLKWPGYSSSRMSSYRHHSPVKDHQRERPWC